MKYLLPLLFLAGCCDKVEPPKVIPREQYKDCAQDGQHAVCTEERDGTKIYIDTFDVLATRETFDPKYRFHRPSKYPMPAIYCIDAKGSPSVGCSDGYPPKEQIPPNAQLISKSDGWIWWHWSQVQGQQ